MSANTSQRKLQSIVLGSDVAGYATWRMIVTCRGCAPAGPVLALRHVPGPAVPVFRLPPGVTLATVLHRLRCARCGSRADRVLLDNQAPDWRRRVIRVWGPGSHA